MSKETETQVTIRQEYFSPEQEAQRLGMPKHWVWGKIRQKVIPAIKVGKYYLMKPAETDAALQKCRQEKKS
jgi:excisionase family DNA binding protein